MPASERSPLRDGPALLAAAWVSLVLTALLETARASWTGHGLALILCAYAVALVHLLLGPVTVWLLPLLAAVEALERRWRLQGHAPDLARLALAVLTVGSAFRTLFLYPDFLGYPPAWVGLGGLLVFAGLAVVPEGLRRVLPQRIYRPWLRWGFVLLGLAGAAGAFAFDVLAYKGDYPTLHLCALQVGNVLLGLGLFHALRLLPRPLAALSRAPAVAFALGLPALAALVTATDLGARAHPYWAAYSTLGNTQPLFHRLGEERGRGDTAELEAARARQLFQELSGLPSLPTDFDLRKYNVLLVMSEAMRFDQTSLADPESPLTPALRRLSDFGAYHFTRAHSPSSGTLQSLSGLFGMSYPSFLEIEIWKKPWTGHFKDRQPTVAELFARADYETFWVSHNNATCFTETVLGLERGFAARELLTAEQSVARNADSLIAKATIAKLRELEASPRRFFGFVFFVSPHSGYVRHFPDMASSTALELYRQEVRYTDAQFGKILAELRKRGRLEDTIVIFSSDHGEEFLEHGGRYHRNTVYSEVTHVPLLIWLPGQAGKTIERPTSSVYLFPWLFLHGSSGMQAAALRRLQRDIGPMLERTSGAVVTELVNPYRMLSSLIYDTRKLNYDFSSRLHQAYRIDRDPGELRDLFTQDSALAREAVTRVGGYRAVRADRRAFVLRSDKRDPRRKKR